MKKIVWRTDSRVFELSETICSGGDHLETLSAAHEGAEEALRNAMGDRGRLRSAETLVLDDVREWLDDLAKKALVAINYAEVKSLV